MTNKIIWKMPDGSIAVTTPNRPMREGEDEEAYLDSIASRAKEQVGVLSDAVRVGEVPAAEHDAADRTYRAAWTWTTPDPVIDIDMPKARAVHMDVIRAVRDAELAKLDIEQLKGNDVAAEKQALRDIPQTFDLSAHDTLDALKAAWPEGLPRP